MAEIAKLRFANEAFYLAFQNRDFGVMDRVWASAEDVTCIHPGWGVLSTREKVMGSWRGILGNPESPKVNCRGVRARILGDTGVVLCYEQIAGAVLAATNVFVREGGEWKMTHHQAGPCDVAAADLEPEPEGAPVQ